MKLQKCHLTLQKCHIQRYIQGCKVRAKPSLQVEQKSTNLRTNNSDLRDGPLDITGGGVKNVRCRNFFYGLLVCRNFFLGHKLCTNFFFSPTDTYLFFATHLTFTQELSLISLLLYYFISQICSLD